MTADGRIGWRCGAACAVPPALIVTGPGYRRLPGVPAGGRVNPDSDMRMVRLRETLAWHRPACVVTRDASGHGTALRKVVR